MKDLRVTLIQSDIFWADTQKNLEAMSSRISSIQNPTDLILLPEMFTTGFTMNPAEVAEKMDGRTMKWMSAQADASNAAIVGSIVIEENGNYYNRLVWMLPGGMYHTYDKKHLFAMAGEHKSYTSGDEKLIVNYQGWRICPMICYDLRFPVWSRNEDNYDILIYLANWPDKRAYDWKTLLQARAIENQAYVIGVNRIGTDPNGHNYIGNSLVVDPGWKKTMYDAEGSDSDETILLSAEHLNKVRSSLPFLDDRDDFALL